MRSLYIYHDNLSKIRWMFFLFIFILAFGILIYSLTMSFYYAFSLRGDWRAGPYLILALFAAPHIYLEGYIVYQFKFVWCVISIENKFIIQSCWSKKYIIDISKPFTVKYVFLSAKSAQLRVPGYQFVEIQQDNTVIRLHPPRSNIKEVFMDLPAELQNICRAYETKR